MAMATIGKEEEEAEGGQNEGQWLKGDKMGVGIKEVHGENGGMKEAALGSSTP